VKSKEEIEAIRDSLEERLEEVRENESDFAQGLVCGAIDALNWAMEQQGQIHPFFSHCADQELSKKKKGKKRIIYRDAFPI